MKVNTHIFCQVSLWPAGKPCARGKRMSPRGGESKRALTPQARTTCAGSTEHDGFWSGTSLQRHRGGLILEVDLLQRDFYATQLGQPLEPAYC